MRSNVRLAAVPSHRSVSQVMENTVVRVNLELNRNGKIAVFFSGSVLAFC
jgi:hypothetical protein